MTHGNEATEFAMREGEVQLGFDPAIESPDAHLVFVGRIRSPWTSRSACPKNVVEARAAVGGGAVEVAPPYRAGLDSLEGISHLILLSWLDRAPRKLIIQKPRHAERPRGTFSLRSPLRPNPIGVHVVKLLSVDADAGILTIDAIDVLDGTPLVDIKPYYASTDSVPEATVARQ